MSQQSRGAMSLKPVNLIMRSPAFPAVLSESFRPPFLQSRLSHHGKFRSFAANSPPLSCSRVPLLVPLKGSAICHSLFSPANERRPDVRGNPSNLSRETASTKALAACGSEGSLRLEELHVVDKSRPRPTSLSKFPMILYANYVRQRKKIRLQQQQQQQRGPGKETPELAVLLIGRGKDTKREEASVSLPPVLSAKHEEMKSFFASEGYQQHMNKAMYYT